MPLGVHRSEHYAEQQYQFPAGSTLLLYTDGLIERRGEVIDTGFARLENALRATTPSDRVPVADAIFAHFAQVAPTPRTTSRCSPSSCCHPPTRPHGSNAQGASTSPTGRSWELRAPPGDESVAQQADLAVSSMARRSGNWSQLSPPRIPLDAQPSRSWA